MPHAMRCTMCCVNWPWLSDYKICPSCDQPTQSIVVLDGSLPLTPAEAVDECHERGVEPPGKKTGRAARRPHVPQLPALSVTGLREDLDRWSKEVPTWLKR